MGLVRPLAGGADEVAQHERLGHEGHGARPLLVGGQLVDELDQRVGERVHARQVPHVVGQAHPEAQRPGLLADVAHGAGVSQPPLGVLHRLVEQAGQPCSLRGDGPQVEVVLCLGQPGLCQLQRLVGGSQRQGLVSAEPGLRHHLVVVAGASGVVGEGDVVAAAPVPQRLEGGLVQTSTLPSEQAALDGLAREVVVEAEDIRVCLHQQPGVHRRPQEIDELTLLGGGDGGKDVEADPSAEHRRRRHDAAHLRVEPVELVPHELGDSPGKGSGLQRIAGQISGTGHQLLEEERVASGAAVERVDGPERRVLLEDGGQEGAHLGGAEPAEADLGDGVPALQPRQQLRGRVPTGEAVGPIRADHQQGPTFGLGQELDGGQALGVRPVEVLEHQQAGSTAGQASNQLHSGPHPFLGRPIGIAHHVEEVGVGGGVRVPEGVEEQLHRAPHRPGIRLPGQHQGAGRSVIHQLLDQAGLPDAGLTGDQGDRGHR